MYWLVLAFVRHHFNIALLYINIYKYILYIIYLNKYLKKKKKLKKKLNKKK